MRTPLNLFMFAQAGAGKDTVADLLLEHHGIRSLALADPIREEYVKWLQRTDHRQNRDTMIDIGETYKRLYGEHVWCRAALDHIQRDSLQRVVPVPGYVIRDGRYDAEYEFFVEQHRFTPVKIVADEDVRLSRLRRRDGDAQLSALEFESAHFIRADRFAHVVSNNGTMSQLRDSLDALITELKTEIPER